MSQHPFFDDADFETAKRYVDGLYSVGAFDPVIGGIGEEDKILTAQTASIREYMRQSQRTCSAQGVPFRIYPALVNAMSPNAFAGIKDGLHVCGLHIGLHAMVYEIACYAMARPNLFPEIGDPSKEKAERIPNGNLPAYWLIDHTVQKGTPVTAELADRFMPFCPQRYEYAVYLSLLMIRFVWFHELHHCLNGHVSYLSELVPSIRLNEVAIPGALPLVELPSCDLPLPADRLYQALELDADRSALYAAYRTQFLDKENIIALAELPRPMRCRMTLFAAYLMTFLFERINERQGTKVPLSHPDSHTRLHDMFRTTAIHLAPLDNDIELVFEQVRADMNALALTLPITHDLQDILSRYETAAVQERLDAHEDDLTRLRQQIHMFGYR